ncbi:MAG: winged helix-turn-helix transcriptional regulator [Phycisphaerales bacterium]|nr:winged helix-turn-helix transcriptional regulator [Phycisphaerales bacterium]
MTLSDDMVQMVVRRLRAIADESRVRLLAHLKAGPANVTSLSRELKLAQASVSKHLAVLRDAGLVDVERIGTQARYFIADESVFQLCQIVCDGVARHLQQQGQVLKKLRHDVFVS